MRVVEITGVGYVAATTSDISESISGVVAVTSLSYV